MALPSFSHINQVLLLALTLTVFIVGTVNLSCFSYLKFARKLFQGGRSIEDLPSSSPVSWTCKTAYNIFGGSDNDDTNSNLDGMLLQGFALPLFLVSCAVVFLLKESPSSFRFWKGQGGDPNVTLWTLGFVLLPCAFVTFVPQTFNLTHIADIEDVALWQARILLLANPSGVAAVVALAFFLIPVAKHSPLIRVFGLSFTQALAFHRVAGWISFGLTLLHGILYCVIYGYNGISNDKAFFEALTEALVPPSRCWTVVDVFAYHSSLGSDVGHDSNKTAAQHEHHGVHEQGNNQTTSHEGGHETQSSGCYGYWRNFTGVLSALAFVILAITSLSRVRRSAYRIFYAMHIPTAWAMLLMAIAHFNFIGLLLIPNIIYYLVSAVPVWIQQFNSSKVAKGVRIERITFIDDSNGCLELQITNNQASLRQKSIGGVCKLCIPEISSIWHPFSIIEDNKTGNVSILLREVGPFTKSLGAIFPHCNPHKFNDGPQITMHLLRQPTIPRSLSMAYTQPSIDGIYSRCITTLFC